MTEDMKKLRNKLAEGRAEQAFGEYSEIKNEEEINAFLAIVTDFRLGFDACYKEMQAQVEELKKKLNTVQKCDGCGKTVVNGYAVKGWIKLGATTSVSVSKGKHLKTKGGYQTFYKRDCTDFCDWECFKNAVHKNNTQSLKD